MDNTITVTVGLPVTVTYDATTDRWSVAVAMEEFGGALEDIVPEFDAVTEDEVATLAENWGAWYLYRPVAGGEVRFVLNES